MTQDVTSIVAAAEAEAEARRRASQTTLPSGTGLAGQFASGLNEGMATILGLPVDAVTSIINGMQSGRQRFEVTDVNPETGEATVADTGPRPPVITNPLAGARSNLDLMDPFIADDPPSNALERYGRSIGADIGASAPFALGALPFIGGNALRYLSMEGASSMASGSAEQAVEDLGGGEGAQAFAALAAGSAVPLVAAAARSAPQGRTVDDVRALAEDAYARRDAVTATLSPTQRQEAIDAMTDPVAARTPTVQRHQPRTERMLETIGDPQRGGMQANPTPQDLHDLRRVLRIELTGSGPAATTPAETRNLSLMTEALDEYLRRVADDPATDPALRQGILDTFEGNDLYRRAQAAETLVGDTGVVTRAVRRASTSGTGGNEVNTIRQNVRAILDNETRRAAFSPDEIAAMERLVEGSRAENLLRLMGRMSPTSGAAPLAGMVTGGTLGTALDSPLIVGGTVAATGAGIAARTGAERLTHRQVRRLIDEVLNGRPLPSRSLTDDEIAVLSVLLASRTGLASQQAQQEQQ